MKAVIQIYSLFFCINFALAGFLYKPGLKMSWDDAKKYCENNGMALAKLDSKNDYQVAKEYIKEMMAFDVWIGMRIYGDNHLNRWTDGQLATYTPEHHKLCFTLRSKKPCIRLGKSGPLFHHEDYKICNTYCSNEYEVLCKGPLPTVKSLNATSVAVSFKRRLTLACLFNSSVYRITKIYWRITKTDVSDQVHIQFTGNEGIAVYKSDKFEKEDVGTYKCFVENSAGIAEGIATTVNLMPDKPAVETNETDLMVFESNKTILFCMAYGYPDVKSIKWSRRSGGKVEATTELFGDVSALVFESTRLADEGTYICSVSNDMGSVNSTEISMQVFLDEPYCECDCEYKENLIYWSTMEQPTMTKDELIKLLRPQLIKLVKENRLSMSDLTSNIYRRKSRKNKTKAAEYMGIVSIVVIIGIYCLTLIMDMTSWMRHLRTIRVSTL